MFKIELLEKLALFYYFSFLDEAKAQAATIKTLKKIKLDNISARRSENEFTAKDFISITSHFLDRSTKLIKPVTLTFSSGYIILPEKSNWGPWFEMRKMTSEKDFRALLYAKVLKFKEEDIAEGLNLPIGTIRYRIGRGLKLLGQLCKPGAEVHG